MNESTNLTGRKGYLDLIVGTGWLSLYEAEQLEPGDLVRFDQIAGYPHRVTYNSRFFCMAEVIITWENFGMRISGLQELAPLSGSFAGAADDAAEFFPVECRLGSAETRISELKGTGPGSLVIFDRKFSLDEDADLFFAGQLIARGKIGVIDENYCLKITRLEDRGHSGVKPLSSGYRYTRTAKGIKYKNYDFRRPDKFSRQQIGSISMIHEIFLRNLGLIVPEAERYEILNIDQMAWDELWPELDKGYRLVTATAGMRSIPAPTTWQAMEGRTSLVVPEGVVFSHAEELRGMIKKKGEEIERKRFSREVLFAIPVSGSLDGFRDGPRFTELVLEPLRQGWKQLAGMNFEYAGGSENRSGNSSLGENDMILVLTIGDRSEEKNRFMVIYPYFTLEPVFSLLDRR